MTREEYERRRHRLDEERRAAIELFEAAHRAQLWALELVWLMSPENQAEPGTPLRQPVLREAGGPHEPAGTAPAASASRQPGAHAPSSHPGATAAAAPSARWKVGETYDKLRQALAVVPEEFDKNDLVRVLGYQPHRGTLHRLLQELEEEGLVRLERRGTGNQTSRYRKVHSAAATAAGESHAAGEDHAGGEARREDGSQH